MKMIVASFMPMSFYSWGGDPFYLSHQRQGGPQNQRTQKSLTPLPTEPQFSSCPIHKQDIKKNLEQQQYHICMHANIPFTF
jgi:hypothetical protein